MGMLFVADPSNLVAMEAGHTATEVLNYVHNLCLADVPSADPSGAGAMAGGLNGFPEGQSDEDAAAAVVNSGTVLASTAKQQSQLDFMAAVLLDILVRTQRWIEIAMRKYRGHQKAWTAVKLTQVVYTVLILFINRTFIKGTLNSFRKTMFGKARSPPGSASNRTGVSPRRPRLVIPRVAVPDRDIEVVGSSLYDYLAFFLQVFYWFRPLMVTYLTVSMSDVARKAPKGIQPSWSVWRLWAAMEAVGVLLSFQVKSRQPPIATAEGDEADSPSSASAAALARTRLQVTDETLQARGRLLSRALLRDPFFDIVLKDRIKSLFVDGYFAKIPLFGGLLALTVNYMLELRRRSFLFTVGHDPAES